MYNNMWLDEFEMLENQKVLLMLSGGKDSSACLKILKDDNINVTAVHFTHKWSYSVSTEEARKLCKQLKVKLIEIDFTDDFFDSIHGYKGGRPCLLCKPKMYEKVIEILLENDYGCICIGDNANDKTTIARLTEYIRNKSGETKYCSTYFGSERGIVLPEKIMVIRPIIDIDSNEVENYLQEKNIVIRKNFSTGDKYFEYSREGCPVQFHDPGYEITLESIINLHKYNLLIGKFASKHNIKASIHLPSTFIVTIPIGYEVEAGKYLEDAGLKINWSLNTPQSIDFKRTLITLIIEKDNMISEKILESLFERLFERLELKISSRESYEYEFEFNYLYNLDRCNVNCRYMKKLNIISIDFISNLNINESNIRNLIIEIFRTRNYTLVKF